MPTDVALCFWMAGVSIAHFLRLVVKPEDPKNRQVIAIAGGCVYGLASVLAWTGPLWASHSICIAFPLIGVTSVLSTGSDVDEWQLAVGVTQFAAIAYIVAGWLL